MSARKILTTLHGARMGFDQNGNLGFKGWSNHHNGEAANGLVVFATQILDNTYTIPDKGGNATFELSAQAVGTNGLKATNIPLMGLKNADGSALAAAAAAGKFGQTITLGTIQKLIGETANSNTKTDDAVFEYVLPAGYIAGSNLTVTMNCSITGAGTFTTKTVQALAYKTATDGTQSANLGPAAVAVTAAGADVTQAITGTTLNPGDKLVFKIEAILAESGAVNSNININSIRIS